MPIYDYVCGSCGHEVEVVHGVHAHGPASCPACGTAGSMRKKLVSPTIHFRGSGWAKKDRGSSSKAGTKAAASGAAEGHDAGRDGSGGGSSGDGSTGEGGAQGSKGPGGDARKSDAPKSDAHQGGGSD